jgi:hypothetical protein
MVVVVVTDTTDATTCLSRKRSGESAAAAAVFSFSSFSHADGCRSGGCALAAVWFTKFSRARDAGPNSNSTRLFVLVA